MLPETITIKDLMALLKYKSTATIYAKLNPDNKRYDPDFPVPIKVGATTLWIKKEVEEWFFSHNRFEPQPDWRGNEKRRVTFQEKSQLRGNY